MFSLFNPPHQSKMSSFTYQLLGNLLIDGAKGNYSIMFQQRALRFPCFSSRWLVLARTQSTRIGIQGSPKMIYFVEMKWRNRDWCHRNFGEIPLKWNARRFISPKFCQNSWRKWKETESMRSLNLFFWNMLLYLYDKIIVKSSKGTVAWDFSLWFFSWIDAKQIIGNNINQRFFPPSIPPTIPPSIPPSTPPSVPLYLYPFLYPSSPSVYTSLYVSLSFPLSHPQSLSLFLFFSIYPLAKYKNIQ